MSKSEIQKRFNFNNKNHSKVDKTITQKSENKSVKVQTQNKTSVWRKLYLHFLIQIFCIF